MKTNSTIDLKLSKKIYFSKKEFFVYELNNKNEVVNYTLTNNLNRYIKKYNFKFKSVDEMRVLIDEQLVINTDNIV
tara:strand:- start:600 stop:827 length:228 start_codon:yes stop_codon:yes gene_type:complete